MLKTTFIRDNKDLVIEILKKRNFDSSEIINQIITLNNDRKKTQQEMDAQLAESNMLAKQVGELFKSCKTKEANFAKEDAAHLKNRVTYLKEKQEGIINQLQQLLYQVPNIPNEIVPAGNSDQDNEIVYQSGGDDVVFETKALPHWELAKKYNIIDFELGVKVTGAGFPFYIGQGARLQRALINFFLDEARDAGYQEIIPPLVVNEASGYGTGQLPDKEGQMYHAEVDDFYLIPTAEVPLTNMFRDVILKKENFPIKVTGYTPCFRREAGSYGKDVRGLNRLHQFDKVELVRFTSEERSFEELEVLLHHAEEVLKLLGLPYRVVLLSTGDLSFAAAKCYDLEVWAAGSKRWLEVSSCSNFTDFQARRMNIKYKPPEGGKPRYVHTLNGSGVAMARTVVALIENYQQADGTIAYPEVLKPYLS